MTKLTDIYTEQEYIYYFVGSTSHPNACCKHCFRERLNILVLFG